MRNIIQKFAILVILLSSSYTLRAQYSGGAGTSDDPYKIATTADLIELSNTSAHWGSHFILTQDIAFDANKQLVDWDGDGTANWDAEDQLGFSPIGKSNPPHFTGAFDGQGFEIDYLFINRTSQNDVGLFGFVSEALAIVKNLGVTNVDVTGGQWGVGGLVGFNNSSSTIDSCYSTGIVRADTLYGGSAGGLVGYNHSSSTISNCYSTVRVIGRYNVGGLVGYNYDSSTINNCYSTGEVGETNSSYAGGLVGFNGASSTISNCYSIGIVGGTNAVGGLVGFNSSSTIDSCNSTVRVFGRNYVGGLVGYNSSSTISNCYSNSVRSVFGLDYVGGLVGWNSSSTISNCYTTGSYGNYFVTGLDYVGGLVGWNSSSTISNCYSNSIGIVAGTNSVGGLVGENSTSSTINNSYCTGRVAGTNSVGGLVGWNRTSSTINNSYSTGIVDGTESVGGLVGENDATVSNSFWDTQTSVRATSSGGTGKTTDEMKTLSTFTDESTVGLAVAWDFVTNPNDDYANDDHWDMDQLGTVNNGYPILSWQDGSDSLLFKYSGGIGTVGNPYQIATTADLIELSNTSADWGANFIQTTNISFNVDEVLVDWDGDGTANWDAEDQLGFSPIGNSTTNFTGTFDGQGFEIDNLFINRPAQGFVGLFGVTDGAAISIIGINNCDITGNATVGGLVGWNEDSEISNSYSTGVVNGIDYVGGLVGWNSSSTINNSYSTVSVTGVNSVGGLVGINSGTVSNSYSIGIVGGTNAVGGLVGENFANVNNSFWDTQTSFQATSAGGTGKLSDEMKSISIFTDETTTGLVDAWDFVGTPYDDAAIVDIWRMAPSINNGYPFFNWDTPENTNSVFVNESCNDETSGWLFSHFDDLSTALFNVTSPGTVNISNYTHTGNVDMTGYTFIIGNEDFSVNGSISGGLIRTTGTGRLMQSAVQNTPRTFPVTDGTHNFTVTITPTSESTSGSLGVKLNSAQYDEALTSPMMFFDISGNSDLGATVTLRIDKSAISPATMQANTIMRFWNGTRYQPIPTDRVTISDEGSYYEITITEMNYFNQAQR